MRKKQAKKLRKVAMAIAVGKPAGEVEKVYKRLKNIHKKK